MLLSLESKKEKQVCTTAIASTCCHENRSSEIRERMSRMQEGFSMQFGLRVGTQTPAQQELHRNTASKSSLSLDAWKETRETRHFYTAIPGTGFLDTPALPVPVGDSGFTGASCGGCAPMLPNELDRVLDAASGRLGGGIMPPGGP